MKLNVFHNFSALAECLIVMGRNAGLLKEWNALMGDTGEQKHDGDFTLNEAW